MHSISRVGALLCCESSCSAAVGAAVCYQGGPSSKLSGAQFPPLFAINSDADSGPCSSASQPALLLFFLCAVTDGLSPAVPCEAVQYLGQLSSWLFFFQMQAHIHFAFDFKSILLFQFFKCKHLSPPTPNSAYGICFWARFSYGKLWSWSFFCLGLALEVNGSFAHKPLQLLQYFCLLKCQHVVHVFGAEKSKDHHGTVHLCFWQTQT